MIGSFAVGKTSLVQQFVNSIFSEKYQTTIGVKVDQKKISHDGKDVNLIIWDIHGEDEFQKIQPSYLKGSSGYLLVVDGTRPKSIEVAKELRTMVEKTVGKIPFKLIINKSDLTENWCITEEMLEAIQKEMGEALITSAKTGDGVEEVFLKLATEMI